MSNLSSLMTHRLRKLAISEINSSEEATRVIQQLLESERQGKTARREEASESVILLQKDRPRLKVI